MDNHQAGVVERQLREALDDVKALTTPRDVAVIELAITYARAIDNAEADLTKAGPLLLQALEALLMTPRSRAAVTRKGGGQDGNKRNALDELRERRSARQHGTTPVDPAAS